MTLRGTRDELENYLIKALSRYIGYTTGAYKLDRIFSVLDPFLDLPSAYESELVDYLENNSNGVEENQAKLPGKKYLLEILSFGVSMGIIELVSDRGARIKRYAPTQLGRSMMGALHIGNDEFANFYRTIVVLRADADALVPILLFSPGQSSEDLHIFYRNFQSQLRYTRLNWLKQVFPEKKLLDRVMKRLPWVERQELPSLDYSPAEISIHTARHHSNPRKKWLSSLGLFSDLRGELTSFGKDVLNALQNQDEYFWLGPPRGVQEGLHVPEAIRQHGPYEDALSFCVNPELPDPSDINRLIEDVTDVMIRAFNFAKLVYAPQASLELPIGYINFRSYSDNKMYNWEEVLDQLFSVKKNIVERFSARKGPVGFYRAKTSYNSTAVYS